MKMFAITALALVAAAQSAKLGDGPLVAVLRDDSQTPLGANYRTAFELDNGVSVDETGSEGSVGQAVVEGSYRYIAPNGEEIVVNYRADENGYVATGPQIPVDHPKPQHALDQIAFAEQQRRNQQ